MQFQELQARARLNESLARHTTSRIGGPADMLIEARSSDELAALVQRADETGLPCLVMGGGANILVADAGVRGLVIINRSKELKFNVSSVSARVEADSGVALVTLARDCIERGLSGMEWAIGVPGTVGGAVVGNAGAHGLEVASNLHMAKILPRGGGEPAYWTVRQLAYHYRTSALKRTSQADRPIVLNALFDLKRDHRTNLERRAAEFTTQRKATQPPGATIGSMFKNPPGDFAGRLIEACALKGTRSGGAMISDKHANFFLNTGEARADDVMALVTLARQRVLDRFQIELELEVELVGAWEGGAYGQTGLRQVIEGGDAS